MFSADLGINQVASTPAATDPPFQKVALLLHGDGTNGAQNNTFVDSSSNAFSITRNGNVAQGTFSPFSLPDGQWSNYFDGSGDYLTLPSGSDMSGTWTVEGWWYPTAGVSTQQTIISFSRSGAQQGINIWCNTSGRLVVDDGNTGQSAWTGGSFVANAWNHFAVVRNGTTTTGYINGISVGSHSFTPFPGITQLNVARFNFSLEYLCSGYITNVRSVVGTVVYTAAFTPPTTALTAITNTVLLTCQSNRFIDNSSNNFTITPAGDTKVTAWSPFAPSAAYDAGTNGGSAYFDGSGDYLSCASNSAFALGSGDYTVEYWIYYNSLSANQTVLDFRLSTFADPKISFYQNQTSSGGKLSIATATTNQITSDNALTVQQWTHIALVRNSNVVKLYINGVAQAQTWNDSTNWSASTPFVIGASYNGGSPINGYMADVRVVKGSAVYTTNFTPPTAPLTAVSGTQLLLNCVNAGIYDNSGKNDIETVGNAQISTSVKKYGTGSMAFDGAGDYLVLANTTDVRFDTGPFTVEAWVYINSYSASNAMLFYNSNAGGSIANGLQFYITSTGTVSCGISAVAVVCTTTATVPLSTWTHLAITRSGNTFTIWIDGVSKATGTNSAAVLNQTLSYIGNNASTTYLNGYIDDLRITKGQALYTSNFTPPTQAFPNV